MNKEALTLLEKLLKDVYSSYYGTKNRVQMIQTLEQIKSFLINK